MSHFTDFSKSSSDPTFFMPSGVTEDSLSSGYFSREDILIRGGLFAGESSESCAEPADGDDVHGPRKRPAVVIFQPSRAEIPSTDIRVVPVTRGRKREEGKLRETPKSENAADVGAWMERVNSVCPGLDFSRLAMTERVQQMGREPNNLEVLLLAAAEIDKDDEDAKSRRTRRKTKRKGAYSKPGHSYKCRKVFGLEQKHKWCNQCRWKKSCIMVPS
ncbi:hypothetical protein RvY_06194 [Ramazzottius varieornatus]|uniref:Uncharacterized protein n=1 Tax=Ramazzottius varieornatus TaxID=947166 RepID=A0A1D1UXP8_RAMVA|nr:hypothetical protein RvY_06194 [Ramazzottius varieornatus]